MLASLAALVAVSTVGCVHCYEIKDPTTGRVYYAKDQPGVYIVPDNAPIGSPAVWRYDNGSISFWDIGSGAYVTLTTSEVKEIPTGSCAEREAAAAAVKPK